MTLTDIKTLKNYIGGEWIEANTDFTEDVFNPATGDVIARVPISSQEDVDNAVGLATEVFQQCWV